jgi:murein DD-endopeptidase MepM/ murein hydrolase activator NlpD
VAIVAGVKKAARWLALVVAVVLVAPPLAAHAATAQSEAARQADIQQEIERLRGELDEVAGDEADVLADLRVTQRRKAAEQAQLAELDAEVDEAVAELQVLQSKLDEASAAQIRAQRRLERVKGQLDAARAALKQQAVASFMRFGSGAEQLDVVLRAKNINELHDAAAFVDALAERQARIVDKFAALQEDTASLEADAEATRAAAASQRNEVQAQTDALQTARDQQAAVTASATAEANHEQALLSSLRGKRAQYEQRIRAFQRESDSIADLLRRRGSGGARISGRGSLSAPLAHPIVTSTFGYRVHPIFGDRRLHTGLDFRASSGTPLTAAAPGEVVFAGWRGGYGNCTIIDHGGGIATLYAHQSSIRVERGDEVKRGQVIGASGSTGFATGPHLHFEVRVSGTPVDPMPYL